MMPKNSQIIFSSSLTRNSRLTGWCNEDKKEKKREKEKKDCGKGQKCNSGGDIIKGLVAVTFIFRYLVETTRPVEILCQSW